VPEFNLSPCSYRGRRVSACNFGLSREGSFVAVLVDSYFSFLLTVVAEQVGQVEHVELGS
jgi:hypothetical protein